ncbi:hypothetical protein MRB53_036963 [Persea americana]|nr:hypothetical protein MRB53_036963 [Persea americana]
MTAYPRPSTDPNVYAKHHSRFTAEGLPTSTAAWLDRARDVAAILAVDGAKRDAEAKIPAAEVSLLKSAGLLKVLGESILAMSPQPSSFQALRPQSMLTSPVPTQYGGGGQPWSTGYKLIRIVASGDGSIGMLLGYHLLWSYTAEVVGTPVQADAVQRAVATGNLLIGGAVNPRDGDLVITQDPASAGHVVFNGAKTFCTGGVVSDLTVLEGVFHDGSAGDGSGEEGKGRGEVSEAHIFTFVPTSQPGIEFLHNWNALGLRLTESGGVRINNVKVPWSDALGWKPPSSAPTSVSNNTNSNTSTGSTASNRTPASPIDAVLGIPFATTLLPTIQLVFSNFYHGIAEGAIAAAGEWTRTKTRAWPYGGDDKERASEEWYILEKYGEWRAGLNAVEALLDEAGRRVDGWYAVAKGTAQGTVAKGEGNDVFGLEVKSDGHGNVKRKGQAGGVNGTNGHVNDVERKNGVYANGTNGTNGINGINGHHVNGTTDANSTTDLDEKANNLLSSRAKLTLADRTRLASYIASAKVQSTTNSLSVTSSILEVMGSRATDRAHGFDRFWRDVRTHTLHDPVAYKKREVGVWELLGKGVGEGWYT